MPEIGRTRKFEEKQRTGTTESALNFRDRPVPVTQDGFSHVGFRIDLRCPPMRPPIPRSIQTTIKIRASSVGCAGSMLA
jgi:hypothetical protein